MLAGNALAFVILVTWPVVAWILFTRLDPVRALIWTILGGYMLLPPAIGIDLPMIPPLDKYSIPSLAAVLAAVFLLKDRFSLWPASVPVRGLILLYLLSPVLTAMTNGDPVLVGDTMIDGMRPYDAVAGIVAQLITLLPFLLAYKYLSGPGGMRALVVALVVAGLIYSVPIMIEARLSPQLNVWVYGYFQHDFTQSIRFGGFRPFVFMPHGLWVAFFAMMCLVASVALLRTEPAQMQPRLMLITPYLAVMLVLCLSAGPLIYAMFLVPVILMAPPSLQMRLAMMMVALVILYPLLRAFQFVPLEQIMDFASSMNAERGQSLAFRIHNEELMLSHAQLRPWFGWGGYGRNLPFDPATHKAVVPDGGWIIALSAFGWLGYIGKFGLLALPVFLIAREAVSDPAFSRLACVIALLLAVNLVDTLPNDTVIPFTWLMAGAVLGRADRLARAGPHARQGAPDTSFNQGRTIL